MTDYDELEAEVNKYLVNRDSENVQLTDKLNEFLKRYNRQQASLADAQDAKVQLEGMVKKLMVTSASDALGKLGKMLAEIDAPPQQQQDPVINDDVSDALEVDPTAEGAPAKRLPPRHRPDNA